MPTIYQLPIQQPAMVGVFPNQKFAVFGDNLATITTAGYLNQVSLESNPLSSTDILQVLYSFNQQTQAGTYGVFTVSISATGVITLVAAVSPGDVLLPVIANHIAQFNGTTGQIYDGSAPAVHGGNIQAGLSGTAGTLASFPGTALKGSLIVAGVANTGNTNTTISNDAMGQASVVNIPDPANAIGQFVIGATATPFVSGNFPKNSGTAGLMVDSGIAVSALATTSTAVLLTPGADQIITVHNLSLAQGNLTAGSSGHAGILTSFPGTASNGSLILAAVNAGGAFNMTVSNAAIGQSTVVSIPDPGATTANFLLDHGTQSMAAGSQLNLAKVSAAESSNAVTASGQAGFITTSSLTTAGGGTYVITWTNTHITATSVIGLTIQGGSNNATNNITFTCAPGSGTTTLTIFNNTAATALNGTLIIGYSVL